jgi:hypothetical protein
MMALILFNIFAILVLDQSNQIKIRWGKKTPKKYFFIKSKISFYSLKKSVTTKITI